MCVWVLMVCKIVYTWIYMNILKILWKYILGFKDFENYKGYLRILEAINQFKAYN